MKSKSKAELKKEIEEIKRMKTLGKILQKGDMESALLSNSSKESEPISEDVIDSMLDNLNKGIKRENADLRLIETLTTKNGGRATARKKAAKPKRQARARRAAKKPAGKAKRKR
ncbi:MAG: hypothetical protein KGH98_04850 [Candidatus Micrarchaeota archaeon]|nr:hypothetical protein [Candidatus Micrarchaeota archaeon]